MYKKADTTGLPEGTDYGHEFQFSHDGDSWSNPMRCIEVGYSYRQPYVASNGIEYKFIRPVLKWEPVPGEVHLAWNGGDKYPKLWEFAHRDVNGCFTFEGGRVFHHIARIDHLTKVPTSVEELKELAGEGNWL